MIINESSWHYKLFKMFNDEWKRPKTLCAYFWSIAIPTFFVSFFGCTILAGLTIICAEIMQKWLIFGSLWTLIPSAFILAILLVLLIIGSFVIPAQLHEKYKDYKWKKDYALHVENIDRAYKGLPPIQPKKSIIVEFLKARKAKVCPVIEYKAE
ncbi:hypothetical protein VIPECOOM01_00093 [Escherichia phage vB_VIPECOOM01]|uniref:Signal-peptide domain-containing protein n=3 Tax=Tequatrovirus vipecoom TaxID=3350239 RepID=A0AAF0FLR4_9CAUD|nr:hypothetical protein VIPECOOM01_00093 [Escherichia phage vB_VIPECOOM01]WFG77987.1 hypothetical protein VIPECOOM02_00093 [Escherichia phage vB_VIPECOOM02]WFG78256.1 hypothetical protein VIPECOOM03_00093 [Escherichia phage vB_VIPECOOM03]